MDKVIEILTGILVAIGVIALVALICGFPTMWLWNWLMTTIFGLCEINFWQAVGLNLLIGFLFGSAKTTKE